MRKTIYNEEDYFVNQKFEEASLNYKNAKKYIYGIDSFAEATKSCIFIFDYYKHNYFHINSFNEYYRKIPEKIENPYLFFNEKIATTNRNLIHQIHHRAFKQAYRLPQSIRKNTVLNYNCLMLASENNFQMTDVTAKVLEIDKKGSIWLVLFILQKSDYSYFKIPTITNIRTSQKFNYDLNINLLTKLSISEQKLIPNLFTNMSNAEIALKLNISRSTVKSHLNNIYIKTGVNNRLDLQRKLLL